jgi:hypothetical protein
VSLTGLDHNSVIIRAEEILPEARAFLARAAAQPAAMVS